MSIHFSLLSGECKSCDLEDFFGMNGISYFHLRTSPQLWEIGDKKLALSRELGVSSQRIDMWWGAIEPEKGLFQWAFPDRVVKEFTKGGQEILPILCYASAWSGGTSPADEQERELFGRYVSRLVERYGKKITFWEVWNEPNITPYWIPHPDALLYLETLKTAFTEAKSVQQGCRIIAPCTAGADLEFIEEIYENGGADYFDILSYHHYPQVYNEGILQREIIDLAFLMMRYGDGEKRIWITEMGAPTGLNTSSHKDAPPAEQAEWMVKAHITALASGKVDRLFWYTLADDTLDPVKEGHFGLVFADFSPKPSFAAYKTMTRLLKDKHYAGSLSLDSEISSHVFQKAHEKIIVLWTSSKIKNLTLPSIKPVRVIDLYGHEEKINPLNGAVSLSLTQSPVYLMISGREMDFIASFKMEPEVVYAFPGESLNLCLYLSNSLESKINGTLSLFAPKDFYLTNPSMDLTLEKASHFKRDITITIPKESPPGFYSLQAHAAFDGIIPGTLLSSSTIRINNPIGISIRGTQIQDQFKVQTTFKNISTKTLSGSLEWRLSPGGQVKTNPLLFQDLKPNDEITTQSRLMPGNREAGLTASVTVDQGAKVEEKIGLMAIPLRLVSPRIDGSLAEWMDIPNLHLDQRTQLIKSSSPSLWTKDNSSGVFQFWLTDDALFIAGQITDDVPLVNPQRGKDLWLGDSIELFLGLKGPSDKKYYQDLDFQIGLSPGDNGAHPEIWNWTTPKQVDKGEIVSLKTAQGYNIEAKIPLSELGLWKPKRQNMIRFDIALNDRDGNDRENPDHTLVWSGTSENWRDPSHWGIAIIW